MFHQWMTRIRKQAFLLLCGLLYVTLPKADWMLPNFKAEFDVQFIGFNIGTAHQNFTCQLSRCTLRSEAKPEGLVAMFINEASVETIQIEQTPNHFLWLSYHKTLTRHKSDRTLIKKIDLVRKNDQILYLQAKPNHPAQWPASDHVYDAISLAYAITYRLANHQPLLPLQLQDEKGQYPLKLLTHKEDDIELPWLDDEVKAHYLKLDSTQAAIQLWILQDPHTLNGFKAFPAIIEVYNKQTEKTVRLALKSSPHSSHAIKRAFNETE